MRTRHRRTALTLTAAATAILLLGGCASGGGGAAPESEADLNKRPDKVDFTLALYGDAKRVDLYEQALPLFTDSQEDVSVAIEFADRGAYYERLTTAAASKKLPDVFWLNDSYFTRYASSGSLLDLTPYIEAKQIDTEGWGETWLPYGEIDGTSYGVPSHFNGVATILDQRILDAAGVKYDAKTWEEAFALGRKLTRPADKVWGVEDITLSFSQLPFQAWVRQHGEELFDDKGQIGFDKKLLVDWWKMWDDLRKDGVIPPPDVQIESQAQGTATALLTHGQVAIRFSSATHVSAFGVLRDGGLNIASFPEIKGADEDWRMYTALVLVAAANTDAPGVAADLIDFLVNDKDAAAITQINMGTPTPPDVAESVIPLLSPVDQQVVEYLNEAQSKPSRPTPPVPEAAESFYDALSRFSQEIAYGRMTPEKAADALFSEATSILG